MKKIMDRILIGLIFTGAAILLASMNLRPLFGDLIVLAAVAYFVSTLKLLFWRKGGDKDEKAFQKF